MQEYTLLNVVTHRSGQRDTFDILPLGYQIFRIVGMVHRLYSLRDNRPFIKGVIHIVGRCTYQLDAFFIGRGGTGGVGPLYAGTFPGYV